MQDLGEGAQAHTEGGGALLNSQSRIEPRSVKMYEVTALFITCCVGTVWGGDGVEQPFDVMHYACKVDIN